MEWVGRELWQGGLQAFSFNSGAKEGQASCSKPVHPLAWGPSCRDLHAARHRPRKELVEAGKDRRGGPGNEGRALSLERWDESSTRGECEG